MTNYTYQQIFSSLKGVSLPSLADFVLPVPGTQYVLSPICCDATIIDDKAVTMLTNARNMNASSFLSYFTATNERTRLWLISNVAKEQTKILFAVKHSLSGELYGYMGLAYGDSKGTYIEADAIVRYSEKKSGLMSAAFTTLIEWTRFDVGIENIWVRVLADNPAIFFYEKCGFNIVKSMDLFMVLNDAKELIELKEDSENGKLPKSNKQIVYMVLSEIKKSIYVI